MLSASPAPPPRLAVIGAGPMGLEAALRGARRGWTTAVYEKEKVGAHILRWGHVRFFSAVRENVSPLAWEALSDAPAPEACLTGREFVARVLTPLAESTALRGKIHEGVRVMAVSRRRMIKTELPGHPLRAERPFRLLLRDADGGERAAEADIVLDASGVYGTPNWAGESGSPCPGERDAGDAVSRALPDILGQDRAHFAGRAALVIGDGHSAATAVAWLGSLGEENPATRVHWVVNGDRSRPCVEVADDPLPERRRTVARANDLAESPPAGWKIHRRSALLELRRASEGTWAATVGRGENRAVVTVDRVLALTGYRGDSSFLEELQARLSPVTGGADGLSQALLGVTDCLSPVAVSPDQLESGEPNFFLIGHKSYGRLNTFLLRSGLQQLDAVFQRLDGRFPPASAGLRGKVAGLSHDAVP